MNRVIVLLACILLLTFGASAATVTNPSFEDGTGSTATGWTGFGTTDGRQDLNTFFGETGAYHVDYGWGAAADGGTKDGGCFQQMTGTYAGEGYSASVWMHNGADTDASNTGRIGIVSGAVTDPANPNIQWSSWVPAQSAWEQATTPTITATGTTITIFLQHDQVTVAPSHFNINRFDVVELHTANNLYPLSQTYGTSGSPFAVDNGGVWGKSVHAWGGGGANSVTVDETALDYAQVIIDAGTRVGTDITLADEQHLHNLGTFTYRKGQGVALTMSFEADDDVATDLFVGYFYGDGIGYQSGVILRAVDGDSANTSVFDYDDGTSIMTGVDFTVVRQLIFVVNFAGDIDFYLDGQLEYTLSAEGPFAGHDRNQLRFGSNSMQVFGGGWFDGTVNVYDYSVSDDILPPPPASVEKWDALD